MPAVEKLIIQGFKSICDAEVELCPVNVLIGANRSGKSNFIGAFDFLRAIRNGQLQDYVARAGPADQILHFGSRVTERVRLNVRFQGEVNQYRITLGSTANDQFFPQAE